jgi:hypothetical protein
MIKKKIQKKTKRIKKIKRNINLDLDLKIKSIVARSLIVEENLILETDLDQEGNELIYNIEKRKILDPIDEVDLDPIEGLDLTEEEIGIEADPEKIEKGQRLLRNQELEALLR